jgi:hypothetical protein
MFPVRNFISRATVWNGSIFIGASGGGLLIMFCATFTAAAQDDWFRRRGVCHVADAVVVSVRTRALYGAVHVGAVYKFRHGRAMLVASRDDRLVMYYFLSQSSPRWDVAGAIGCVWYVYRTIEGGDGVHASYLSSHRKI